MSSVQSDLDFTRLLSIAVCCSTSMAGCLLFFSFRQACCYRAGLYTREMAAANGCVPTAVETSLKSEANNGGSGAKVKKTLKFLPEGGNFELLLASIEIDDVVYMVCKKDVSYCYHFWYWLCFSYFLLNRLNYCCSGWEAIAIATESCRRLGLAVVQQSYQDRLDFRSTRVHRLPIGVVVVIRTQ